LPWTLSGTVRRGKLAITFPSEGLELPESYGGYHTGGVRMAEIHLDVSDNSSMKVRLHKYDKKYDPPNMPSPLGYINIYYADGEFTDFYDGSLALKKGWNFVETWRNYRADGSYEGESHSVSQNIDDFLDKGYRWTIEYWF
jgi:hypothetical protein